MHFKVSIPSMGNAAFEEPHLELATILKKVVGKLEYGESCGIIHDTNGNRVGEWSIYGWEDDDG